MKKRGLLQQNPDPIRLVPAAQRDVWFKKQGWRCEYEDGRGRCSSRETRLFRLASRIPEAYCEKHEPR